MERMSLEEREQWYKNHLEEIVLRVCHGRVEDAVYCAKMIGFSENIPDEFYLDEIIWPIENEIRQHYYGSAITEQVLCKQEWLGCDLSEAHNEIKNNNYETAIHCIIKDKKIVKKFYSKGTAESVKMKYAFDDIINEAKELNADGIYHFHNHPIVLAAWPSENDVRIASKESTKALKNNLLYNYGVVSCKDYWDYNQINLSDEEIIKKDEERFFKENEVAKDIKMSLADIARKLKEVTDKQ